LLDADLQEAYLQMLSWEPIKQNELVKLRYQKFQT
jgi:hypothetical protein